jgi:hypothetical protein
LKSDLNFLERLVENADFKIEKIQEGNNIYEYTVITFPEAVVIASFEIEYELLDDLGNHVGYFGIDFNYKRIAYFLFKNMKIKGAI